MHLRARGELPDAQRRGRVIDFLAYSFQPGWRFATRVVRHLAQRGEHVSHTVLDLRLVAWTGAHEGKQAKKSRNGRTGMHPSPRTRRGLPLPEAGGVAPR